MPRKRRKAINTETTPDIPFQKVRVEWVDCVSDSGWASEKEFNKMKLATPVNEGWLYEKTKDQNTTTETKTSSKIITSTLNPTSFLAYNGGVNLIDIDLINSWNWTLHSNPGSSLIIVS